MLINHVVPSDAASTGVETIVDHFEAHAPDDVRIEVTNQPLPEASIYHYHQLGAGEPLSQPAVVTIYQDLFDPHSPLHTAALLPRYREAAQVVCLNRTQQEALEREGIGRTEVIPYGYDDSLFHPKSVAPRHLRRDGKITLGLFADLDPDRPNGESYLADLVKRLDRHRVTFLLAGKRRLKTADLLASLRYEVRLFEMIPHRVLQSLHEAVDYLLVCRDFEAGPANLIEAMATGTPLLAKPVGIAPDVIVDGENGLILGHPDDDAERILRLADLNDPLVATLEDGAAKLASTAPTWPQVIGRYLELYRATHGGGR